MFILLTVPMTLSSGSTGRDCGLFLEPLSPCERETFLSRYRAELSAAYPRQPNGKVLLRYPRLFFVAQK